MANTAEICKRLKQIENLQETDELFHEVIECLNLKYNDVECVSVRVLAGWGSQRCVDTLKNCLLECYPVKKNLQFTNFILKSLAVFFKVVVA